MVAVVFLHFSIRAIFVFGSKVVCGPFQSHGMGLFERIARAVNNFPDCSLVQETCFGALVNLFASSGPLPPSLFCLVPIIRILILPKMVRKGTFLFCILFEIRMLKLHCFIDVKTFLSSFTKPRLVL